MLRKHSGELIGDCGCFTRELYGDIQCELGWHVRREFWGNGYASEAARHCIEYAFSRLGMARIIALIRPENRSSCRVAEKNGMTCERSIFWRGYDHSVYVKQR
jgi:[ribosomal protein S5]-alanine N-acetyltransferase